MACWVMALALSASPPGAPHAALQPVGPRSDRQLNRDLRNWMRRESLTRSPAERVEAIQQLAALYREASRDPRLAARPTLRGYRAVLRGRLTTIQRELEEALARQRRGGSAAALRRKGLAAGSREPIPGSLGTSIAARSSGGARGGAFAADYGPALVALIERTISPDSWEGQGGRGTIVYYRPGRALVVHATPEIHRRVGRLLQALRDAGR